MSSFFCDSESRCGDLQADIMADDRDLSLISANTGTMTDIPRLTRDMTWPTTQCQAGVAEIGPCNLVVNLKLHSLEGSKYALLIFIELFTYY